MSRPKQPDLSPAALARAIVMLRAQGKDEEADELAAYLPPAHDPLPHLDGNGLPIHHTGPVPEDTDPKTPPPATGMPMPTAPGGLSPHGPPQPDNPHSAGSAPPRVMKAFDPNEKRDDSGKWSGGGDSGATPKLTQRTPNSFTGEFSHGGVDYAIHAHRASDEVEEFGDRAPWTVEFDTNSDSGRADSKLTGAAGHSAIGAMRTVGATVSDWMASKKPPKVAFLASSSEPSRVKLYARLAAHLAEKHGYTVFQGDGGANIRFLLVRDPNAKPHSATVEKAFDPTSPLDQIAYANLPAFVHDANSTSSPNATPAPRLGCVMLPLPVGAADRVLSLGRMIPDHDLADSGRDEAPHTTAAYGLHHDDPLPVYRVLENFRPVKLKLGQCSVFPGKEYDVLKIDVESDALRRLNSSLRSLPHTSTYKNFVPHVTIARVLPGLGAVYAARFGDLDMTCVADVAVFSDSQKQRSMVPLGRMVRIEKSAMSYLNSGTGGALVAPAGGMGKPIKLRRKKRRMLARMCKDALAEFDTAYEPPTAPAFFPNADFDAEEFVFGTKATDSPAHAEGQKFQGEGGQWFVIRDGHAIPTKKKRNLNPHPPLRR